MIHAIIRRLSRQASDRSARLEALNHTTDAALKSRRAKRPTLKAAAIKRERDAHHARFVRDPIIRALRPDAIKGE